MSFDSSGSRKAAKHKLCHDGLVNSVAPTETQTELEFRFFGEPEFFLDKQELHLPIRKLMALMAYLAVEGSGSRSKLAGLLWSELDETSARRNLRQRLYRLSPPELTACLQIESDKISLGVVSSDVQDFTKAIQHNNFLTAVRLYKGVFLEGLELEDASAFHDWLDTKRNTFARQYQHALAELANQLEADGHFLEALQQHLLLIAINPLLELHQRQIMRLHLQLRQPAEGLAVFERFRDLLGLELGLEPTPETLLLASQMRQQETQLESVVVQKSIRGFVSRTPMIGRAGIWQQLEKAWQAGQMVFIGGEPGMGKSRLLEEFATTRPTLTTLGRIGDSSLPFATQTRAIRGLLELNPQLSPPAWIRQELSRLIPALHDTAPEDRPESRLRLFDAFTELLWMTTQSIDTHLIDDLQFFDSDSFEMLLHSFSRFLERPNQKRQILAFRHGELSPAMQHSLDQMIQSGTATLLQLEPLDNLAVQHLVQHLFGANVDLSNKLYRATGGNPFFALETLKTLVESDALQQNTVGRWDATNADLPMPHSVMAVVRERVARLGSEATRLLETASLAGDTFALEDIQNATTLTEFQALEAFEKALALQLLEQQAGGYRFSHDLVRESIASGLGTERRRLLHKKLAVNLEQRGGAATRIAWHLEQSGQAVQAVGWRIKAAEEAGRVYAHQEAINHYKMALQDGADAAQAFKIHLVCLDLFGYLHNAQGEMATLSNLETLALADPQLSAIVATKQADVAYKTGRYLDCLKAGQRVLDTKNVSLSLQLEGQYHRGMALEKLGRSQEAQVVYLLAFEQLVSMPAKKQIGLCVQLCYLSVQNSDFVAAANFLKSAFELCETQNSLRGRSLCYNASARLALSQGKRPEAIKELELALKDARAIFDRRLQESFLFNCIRIHVEAGELDIAQNKLEEVINLLPEPYEPLAESNLLTRLAEIQMLRGNLAASLESYRKAVQIGALLGQSQNHVWQVVGLSRLHSQIGDLAGARSVMEQLLKAAKEGTYNDHILVQAQLAGCEYAEGQLETARQRLTQILQTKQTDYRENRHHAMYQLGMVELARHQPQKALAAIAQIDHSSTIFACAMSIRLKANSALGNKLDSQAAEALLANTSLPPLQKLELYVSLARTLAKTSDSKEAAVFQELASTQRLELASSLISYPDLQRTFLEKHSNPQLE